MIIIKNIAIIVILIIFVGKFLLLQLGKSFRRRRAMDGKTTTVSKVFRCCDSINLVVVVDR